MNLQNAGEIIQVSIYLPIEHNDFLHWQTMWDDKIPTQLSELFLHNCISKQILTVHHPWRLKNVDILI